MSFFDSIESSTAIANQNPRISVFYGKSGIGKTPLLAGLKKMKEEDPRLIDTLPMVVSNYGWKVLHIDVEKNGGAQFIDSITKHLPTIEAYDSFIQQYKAEILKRQIAFGAKKEVNGEPVFKQALADAMNAAEDPFALLESLGDKKGEVEARLANLVANMSDKEKQEVYPYMVGVIDVFSIIADWSEQWAATKYKKTMIGKNFKADNILELGQGGWPKLWEEIKERLWELAAIFPHLIIVAHTRDKLVKSGNSELEVKDLDLKGKFAFWLVRNVDAVCYMYPNSDGKIQMSFKRDDEMVESKGKCPHLWDLRGDLDFSKIFINPNN